MSFGRPSLSSRYFGLAGSIAVHCVLGFALLATVARAPGGETRRAAPGHRALVVEMLPLPSGGATGRAAPEQRPLPAQTSGHGITAGAHRGASIGAAGQQTQHPAAATPAGGARAGATAADTTAGAPSIAGSDSLQFRAQLLRHIERFRRYPEAARAASIEGEAQIQFVMGHDGRVTDIWVELSSGSALLDEEAMAAVLRAQPLPRPPASWPASVALSLPIGYALK